MKKVRTIAALVALTAALTVTENYFTKSLVPYTKEDIVSTSAYVTTLEELETTNVTEFENPELIEKLSSFAKKQLTIEDIRNIKSLEIRFGLDNYDFSDLKYFTNLEEITIFGANVDLEDLQYNQNLKKVTLSHCNVTNTNKLPNSVTDLFIFETLITDDVLYLPYNIAAVSIMDVGFSKIQPKGLKELFYFSLDSKVCSCDISFLADAPNLLSVTIKGCPNITGVDTLTKLSEKCEVSLDDYAPIWLTNEQYHSIKKLDPEIDVDLDYETKYLDLIASELVPDKNVDEHTKVEAISNYIVRTLKYSLDIINNTDRFDEVSSKLNDYPIKYAIDLSDDYDEVCINYAALFQALANRVGLDSKQLMSDTHTWNLLNDKYIDLTSLDGAIFQYANDETNYSIEDLLIEGREIPDYVYYVRDIDLPDYKETYHLTEPTTIDENIGYVKQEEKSLPRKLLQYSNNLLISIAFLTLLSIIKHAYDNLRYIQLDKEVDEEIEQLSKK